MRWTLIERPWHLVDDGILPYALALMRSLWVWAWLRLINTLPESGDYGLLSWPAIFGLLACSTAIAQIASYVGQANRRRPWPERLTRSFVALSGLLAVVVTVYGAVPTARPAAGDWSWLAAPLYDPLRSIPALLIATWLWWWGVLAGRFTIFYETYASNFAVGMAGLGLAAAVGLAVGRAPFGLLIGPALLFVAVSLITLAVASLRAARRYEREHFDPTFRVSRYWLATIVGVVVVLLAVGLLVVQLLTPDLVRRTLAALSPVLDLLAQGLWYVLMVIAWVIFTLLEPLVRSLRARQGESEPFRMPSPPDLTAQLREMETHPATVSPDFYHALRIVAAILLVGIVVLIFALAFKRFRAMHEEDVVEVRDSVLSLDLLKTQLQELFRRRRPAPQPPPFVNIAGDDPAARIRRTYQALLAWAASQDMPRAAGMTPEEYLRFLGAMWPDCQAMLATITAAYLRARYSAEPVPVTAADEAARAWEQIVQRGRNA